MYMAPKIPNPKYKIHHPKYKIHIPNTKYTSQIQKIQKTQSQIPANTVVQAGLLPAGKAAAWRPHAQVPAHLGCLVQLIMSVSILFY